MQERCNSIANALELHLSRTNTWISHVLCCRYASGCAPWGSPSGSSNYSPQRHDDGCLEVIGLTTTTMVGLYSTIRVLPLAHSGRRILLCSELVPILWMIFLTIYILNCFEEAWRYICIFLLSFLQIDVVQVVKILSHEKQGPVYPAYSISGLLIT